MARHKQYAIIVDANKVQHLRHLWLTTDADRGEVLRAVEALFRAKVGRRWNIPVIAVSNETAPAKKEHDAELMSPLPT